MNGIQLARATRDRQMPVPILLVTGYAEQLNAADTSFPVLRKPFRLISSTAQFQRRRSSRGHDRADKLHANRRAEGAAEG